MNRLQIPGALIRLKMADRFVEPIHEMFVHSSEDPELNTNKSHFNCLRVLIQFVAKFLNLRLGVNKNCNKQPKCLARQSSPRNFTPSSHSRATTNRFWRGRAESPGWSELLMLLYALTIVHLTILAWAQYTFDYSTTRSSGEAWLDCFREAKNESFVGAKKPGPSNSPREMGADCENARWAEALLRRLGSPRLHRSYLVEHVVVTMIIITVLSYATLIIKYNLLGTYDCYALNDLLDSEQESVNKQRLVDDVLNKLHKSHQIHSQNVSKSAGGLRWATAKHGDEFLHHLEVLGQAKALKLFNSTNGWLNKRARLQFISFNLMSVYNFVVICSLYASQYLGSGEANKLIRTDNDLMIWLFKFELLYLCLITHFSSTFHGVNLLVRLFDQLALVRKTRQVIIECYKTNGKLHQTLSGGSLSDEAQSIVCASMNLNLLFAIFQLKLFVAQFNHRTRRMFEVFTVVIAILVAFPVLTRINLTYVDHTSREQRIQSMSTSASVMFVANSILLSLCLFYNCCLDLHKSANYLMAHIIRVDYSSFVAKPIGDHHEPKDNCNRVLEVKVKEEASGDKVVDEEEEEEANGSSSTMAKVYDTLTVALLRKELGLPRCVENRFAIKSLGMSCTYMLICKIHFWVGLLLLPILITEKPSQSLSHQHSPLNFLSLRGLASITEHRPWLDSKKVAAPEKSS